MLSNESRTKAEMLQSIVNEEISGKDTYSLLLGDIKWLADTLIDLDNKFKKMNAGLIDIMDKEWAAHWERTKENESS